MTKIQFLKQLDFALKNLSASERQDILKDYEEYFDIGLEEGKTEEQIAFSLGDPEEIAKELLITYHIKKVETKDTSSNMLRTLIAIIGLGFFNLVFILGPYLALLGIVLGGWITGITFIGSPFLLFIKFLIIPSSFKLLELFSSIALCGAGIFLILGMFFVTKLIIKISIRYVELNLKIITGGSRYE